MGTSDLTEFLRDFALGPFGWSAAVLWGAVWGSFFNVLIVRIPAEESLVRPVSHCRSCGEAIRWYDNVPILSYLLLRGRCRRCGARFSPRYLLVELLVAGLAVLLYHSLVHGDVVTPIGLRLARFVVLSLFAGLLVAITFIDLDTMRIPDAITYPGIPVCIGLSLFFGHPHWWDGLAGGAAGYLLIRLLADGYRLVTGRTGMGYGDAKLLAMIGGLLGWQALLPVLFLSALQGSVIGISLLALFRARRRGDEKTAATPADEEEGGDDEEPPPDPSSLRYAKLPFGPFLGLAALEVVLLRDLLGVFFPYLY